MFEISQVARSPRAQTVAELGWECRNALLPPPDALHLIELSERIKSAAKVRLQGIQKRHEPQQSLDERMGSDIADRKSNPRRKYQEYFQIRQHAAVMMDEYLSSQETLKEQQVDIDCIVFLILYTD